MQAKVNPIPKTTLYAITEVLTVITHIKKKMQLNKDSTFEGGVGLPFRKVLQNQRLCVQDRKKSDCLLIHSCTHRGGCLKLHAWGTIKIVQKWL